MPSGAAVGQGKKVFRPDIQGLRAIAVLAVFADHLFAWPSGGFVGVDVFFVISGFLITSLLLREHHRTGRISFLGFYRRRIRRIIPAAMLVIVATLIAAFLVFNRARFDQTLWDSLWATFFGSNWYFAIQGTDYFGAAAAVSPLQHYWSLSVEEQFYFVWPWLMLAIYAIVAATRGTAKHARSIILFAIAAITAVSFAWAVFDTSTNATWAYFSTFSRVWELGIGATIAVCAPWFTRIPAAMRAVIAWLGLGGIIAGVFLVNAEAGFPAPWAALPVLATGLVIISGTGGDARFVQPISNPVSNYIGDISYSLYLWHWPVIVFAGVVLPVGPVYYASVIAIAVLAAALTYVLVEDPIRKSRWLEPGMWSRLKRRDHQEWGWRPKAAALTVLGVVTLGAVGAALGGATLAPPTESAAPPARFQTEVGRRVPAAATASPSDAMLGQLQDQISQALSASAWPADMTPSMDEVIANNPGAAPTRCQIDLTNVDLCSWGPPTAPTQIVLVGDSTSVAYAHAFEVLAQERGDVRVTMWSMNGCRFSMNTYSSVNPQNEADCPGRVRDAIIYIQATKPTAVVITGNYANKLAGTQQEATDDQWVAGLADAVSQIADSTAHVVFLTPPPAGVDPAECFTRVSTPVDCVAAVSSQRDRAVRQPLEKALADRVGAVFIDGTGFVCAEDRCPPFVGTVPTRYDAVHISGPYAEFISPIINQMLIDRGVLPPTP